MSLPRIDSRSPLQDIHYDRKSSNPMSFALNLQSFFHPRKVKHRTTIIGLLFIVFVTTYIFLAHSTTLSPSLALRAPPTNQLPVAIDALKKPKPGEASSAPELPSEDPQPLNNAHKHHPSFIKGKNRHRPNNPPLQLSLEQELASISSFIASLPQNVIPLTVDPSEPIDPELILDFDTRTARAQEEVRAVVHDVWTRNPVFLYSKRYGSHSRELKSILSELYLHPAPTIVDVDVREDADVLKPILARLSGTSELPLLLVGGKYAGTLDEIKEMSKNGELERMVSAAGAQVNGAKKKKHRK